jgi:hypothetical protein
MAKGPSSNANDQQRNNNTINASFWTNALNDLGLWASHQVKMAVIFSGSKAIVVVGCCRSFLQSTTQVFGLTLDDRGRPILSELTSFLMAPKTCQVGCCCSHPLSVDDGSSSCWEES